MPRWFFVGSRVVSVAVVGLTTTVTLGQIRAVSAVDNVGDLPPLSHHTNDVSHPNPQSTATADTIWTTEPESFLDKNRTDDTCYTSHTTCDACNAHHLCHWCNHDTRCHAVGSVHGCVVGSKCPKKKPGNDTDPTGCQSHTDCASCTLSSSHMCHWCSHDNQCHAVGSMYGCRTGVDCYDNPHCQRNKPEPLPETASTLTNGVGILPLVVVTSLSTLLICCSTLCCCLARGIKGAYDDLVDLTPPMDPVVVVEPTGMETPTPVQQSQGHTETPVVSEESDSNNDGVTPTETQEATADVDNTGPSSSEGATSHEMQSLLHQDEEANVDDYALMVDTNAIAPLSSTQQPRRPRTMKRMYNACVCCHIFTVSLVSLVSLATVRYFPKRPVYSICNDSVAWKSLIDSMTARKAAAEFELLASVSNQNHLDAVLEMGKGTFYHEGAFVGTYEIPPVTVAAMAITDTLIVATFSPEKWKALAIAKEYYRGTLVLHVDTEVTIRVPALMDYTLSAELKDLVVNINATQDRSLCACPTWSDAHNATTPPVPVWMN